MRTFVRVVDAGSLSGAAEQAGVAKSAVSRRLRELEDALGVTLLQRTTRSLTLTPAGSDYLSQCIDILNAVDAARDSVQSSGQKLSGKLRIAAPLTFGLLHVSPAVCEFQTLHPDVVFDVDLSDRRTDLIREGIDAAIRIGRQEDSALLGRRFARIGHTVCASPAYLDAHGTPQSPAELNQHRILDYSGRSRLDWHYTDPNGKRGAVRTQSAFRANNGSFVSAAAIAGLGVCLQPDFIVSDALRAGSLVPILDEYRWQELDAWVLYPRTHQLPRRLRNFIDFFVDRFRAGLPWE